MAKEAGRFDVDRWLAGLSPGPLSEAQFREWQAFFALEPWGGLREDARNAKVVAAVYNANPFRRAGSPPVRAADVWDTLAPPLPPPAAVADKVDLAFSSFTLTSR